MTQYTNVKNYRHKSSLLMKLIDHEDNTKERTISIALDMNSINYFGLHRKDIVPLCGKTMVMLH